MIVRVALKLKGMILIGKKNARHDSLFTHDVLEIILAGWDKGTQGFITDDGEFLNRIQAGIHAYHCGQTKDKRILTSEDLW